MDVSKKTEGKKHEYEYDFVRAVLTILVIIGHCNFLVISSDYGGVDYSYIITNNNKFAQLVIDGICKLIYSFHMPLFMALSGALFQYTNAVQQNFGKFFTKKVHRLLVPFFAVNIIYSIPIKYISHYWHGKDILKEIVIGQILLQGNTYLWFLIVLFFEFIIVYGFLKIKFSNQFIWIISMIMFVMAGYIDLVPLNTILANTIVFWSGVRYEANRRKIENKYNCKSQIILFELWIILFGLEIIITKKGILNETHLIVRLLSLAVAAFGSLFFLNICYFLSKSKSLSIKKFINKVAINSFGLYLYSDPINYLILFLISLLIPVGFTFSSPDIILLFIFRICCSFIIAYILSVSVRTFSKGKK